MKKKILLLSLFTAIILASGAAQTSDTRDPETAPDRVQVDLNDDGIVNKDDTKKFFNQYSSLTDEKYDLNCDGNIDVVDVQALNAWIDEDTIIPTTCGERDPENDQISITAENGKIKAQTTMTLRNGCMEAKKEVQKNGDTIDIEFYTNMPDEAGACTQQIRQAPIQAEKEVSPGEYTVNTVKETTEGTQTTSKTVTVEETSPMASMNCPDSIELTETEAATTECSISNFKNLGEIENHEWNIKEGPGTLNSRTAENVEYQVPENTASTEATITYVVTDRTGKSVSNQSIITIHGVENPIKDITVNESEETPSWGDRITVEPETEVSPVYWGDGFAIQQIGEETITYRGLNQNNGNELEETNSQTSQDYVIHLCTANTETADIIITGGYEDTGQICSETAEEDEDTGEEEPSEELDSTLSLSQAGDNPYKINLTINTQAPNQLVDAKIDWNTSDNTEPGTGKIIPGKVRYIPLSGTQHTIQTNNTYPDNGEYNINISVNISSISDSKHVERQITLPQGEVQYTETVEVEQATAQQPGWFTISPQEKISQNKLSQCGTTIGYAAQTNGLTPLVNQQLPAKPMLVSVSDSCSFEVPTIETNNEVTFQKTDDATIAWNTTSFTSRMNYTKFYEGETDCGTIITYTPNQNGLTPKVINGKQDAEKEEKLMPKNTLTSTTKSCTVAP